GTETAGPCGGAGQGPTPRKRLECTAAGRLRQDPASRCAPARTAPTDELLVQAGGCARQASVLVDRGHRPWAYRGTGGAHACRTRRGRRLADRAGTTCPHTPAQVAPLRCRSNGLVLAGLCAAARAAVEGFPWPGRPRGWVQLGGRSPGLRLAAAVLPAGRRRKVRCAGRVPAGCGYCFGASPQGSVAIFM